MEEQKYVIHNSDSVNGGSLSQLNMKLDHALRYAELCERRVLDYQPDHPLPIREEHLGFLFANNVNGQNTSGQKTMSPNSPSLAGTLRQDFVNRFESGFDANSLGSGSQKAPFGQVAEGSPKAMQAKTH